MAGEEEAGEGLPASVFEDRGAGADVRLAPSSGIAAVRGAVADLLRAQSQGSPLWAAYATHEALHGNIKVGLSDPPDENKLNTSLIKIYSN